VTVFETERIAIEWSILLHNGNVLSSREDSGRVKLHATEKGLEIYLSREQAASRSCPVELVEFMAEFCGIKDSQNIMLLQYILAESDLQNISDSLDRRGIPDSSEQYLSDFGERHFKRVLHPILPGPNISQ